MIAAGGRFRTIEQTIGNTPLVRLQRIAATDNTRRNNVILGNSRATIRADRSSDRPAWSMISTGGRTWINSRGDRLIEATSGNTGIALAMIAAMTGYRMTLIMPDNLLRTPLEHARLRGGTAAYTSDKGGMEYARDLALEMQARGEGVVLDQFANTDNPRVHYETTGPEVWRDTDGRITHFVSAMGTTGTIMGVSRYLKEKNRRFRSSARNRRKAHKFPAFANGPKNICRRSTIRHASIGSSR